METKEKFSEFIARKRKEVGLTQKVFAERLFVSDTAVSKWERGISYPDITLISRICQELKITEHEFITACDDPLAKVEKRQARYFRNILNTYQRLTFSLYGIALFVCFVVNLAVDHTISWFFIVLVSIALAFSLTNLPIILKKYKLFGSIGAMTICIYLLLFVCNTYVDGNWLLSTAYPIATVPLLALWVTLFIIIKLTINIFFKIGFTSFLLGATIVMIEELTNFIIVEDKIEIFKYFNLT
ncbi:MAG: helix-turn-helix transcriptional regulator, partial [Peptostreptococcales bacterium]